MNQYLECKPVLQTPMMGILLLAISTKGLARWDHRDAEQLNKVTGLGSEYYNDILSYRDPRHWEDIWDSSSLGFRTGAGSMNQKDFFFHQAIKLTSSTQDNWRLTYSEERVEEPRRIRDESALELSYGSEQDRWRLGLMGEGQTDKAFVDIGLLLSHRPDATSHWQIKAWAMDAPYAQKKKQPNDYRTRMPWSWEFFVQEKWGNASLQARHTQDQAFAWYQFSEDQRYAWRSQASELRWTYLVEPDHKIFLHAEHDQQSEALSTLSLLRVQDYQDRRSILELGHNWVQGRESFTGSIWGFSGRTREQLNSETQFGSHSWTRQELAFLGTWSQPFWKDLHDQHWGVALNQIWLDEESREVKAEVKLIWGPDFALNEHGRVRFTTTWDLDQVLHDFPFTKKSLHPWGGGQASFLMVF